MSVELFIINLVSALVILFFIALVARTGLAKPLNRNFLYFLIALLGWVVLNYFSNQIFLDEWLLLINRLLFVVSAVTMGLMLRFCLFIRGTQQFFSRDLVLLSLILLAVAISLTPLVVEDVSGRGDVIGVVFGWAAPVYFAILGIFAIWIITRLSIDAIKASGLVRARARALSIAFGLGLGLLAITNVLLPTMFDLFYLSAVGSLFIVVMLSGVGYSIVKYHFLDIRLFIARSLAYIFTIVVLALLYSVLTFGLLTQITGEALSLAHEIIYFLIALVLGLTFAPMKRFFDKLSDRIFYKDHYEIQEVLNFFSELMLGEIRLDKLLNGSLKILGDSLKFDFGYICVVDEQNRIVKQESTDDKEVSIGELAASLGPRYQGSIVVNNSFNGVSQVPKRLQKFLSANGIEVVLNLRTPANSSIGYVLLGAKRSGSIYTDQDIRLLNLIASALGVAIESSLRFEEIQNFNETLQDKVDAATRRLRKANERLRQLDATKDEFVSMASHQLRTPLTSVKGYLSMVLEGDAGKLNPTQEKLLKEAFTSSERMVRLIGDFLNVSRLRTGKFVIERKPVNMAELVKGEVTQLKPTAEARELSLTYEQPKDFPEMDIDKSKIQQVVMNFLDNAIFYSKPGGKITVELYQKQNDIIFKVKDQGIGVPDDEKKRLFTKFYRASNARKQRPDGTGIGLFMAQKVIIAHGGAVIFESKEGEGSTFGFRLPLKLSAADKERAESVTNEMNLLEGITE